MPSSANNDRVATTIGPGQPSVVLNTLLNGSKFDYVILGVTGNPGAVQKVILTPRSNTPVATAQNNSNQQPEETSEDTAENEPEPEPTPLPPGVFHRPGSPLQRPPNQNGFNANENSYPPEQSENGGKTPEQLMQELQQMQQQQQQLQEQLNPANRQPPQ